MKRIDSVGATEDNLWTNGDPVGGVAATRMDASWFNSAQEEICAVIEATSATLDDEDNTQLLTAIQDLVVTGIGTTKYTHTEAVAATTWTINHSFGSADHFVQCVDSSGVDVQGTVTRGASTTTVAFAVAQAGKAYLVLMT